MFRNLGPKPINEKGTARNGSRLLLPRCRAANNCHAAAKLLRESRRWITEMFAPCMDLLTVLRGCHVCALWRGDANRLAYPSLPLSQLATPRWVRVWVHECIRRPDCQASCQLPAVTYIQRAPPTFFNGPYFMIRLRCCDADMAVARCVRYSRLICSLL